MVAVRKGLYRRSSSTAGSTIQPGTTSGTYVDGGAFTAALTGKADDLRGSDYFRPEQYGASNTADATKDGPALLAAVAAAKASGGGTVVLSARTYLMGTTQIELPEADLQNFTNSAPVNLKGHSVTATKLKWATDLGSGQAGIYCGTKNATLANTTGRYGYNFYESSIQDLTIEGPATTAGVMGEAPKVSGTLVQMTGVNAGARLSLKRVNVSWFYKGVDFVGDNIVYEEVYTPNNYYGLYFNKQNPSLYGDMVFTKCFFDNCTMAGIGVHRDSKGILGAAFNSCYFAENPYGILMEPLESGATTTFPILLGNVIFDNCMFEGTGNADIHDDGTTVDSVLTNVIWRQTLHGWKTATKIAARARTAVIDVGTMEACIIQNIRNPQQWIPGDTALLNVGNYKGLKIEGNIDAVNTVVVASGKPWLAPQAGTVTVNQVTFEQPGRYKGVFMKSTGFSAAWTAGDVLMRYDSRFQAGNISTQDPVAGIALQAGVQLDVIPVVTEGESVAVNISGSVTATTWLKKGASAKAIAAAHEGDGQIVGMATSGSGSVWNVVLKPGGIGAFVRTIRTATNVATPMNGADPGTLVQLNNAAAITYTIATNASIAVPVGTIIELSQQGAGQVTVAGASGVVLRTARSSTTRTQYSVARLHKIGPDEWQLSGDLT